MKKFFILIAICIITTSCFKTEESSKASETQNTTTSSDIENKKFSFTKDTLSADCTDDSQIICTINLALKCTINPDFAECKENKNKIPDFIFMVDDSLDRPTEISYQVTKLKSLDGNLIEVHTQSQCNGNWFGLCKGNIIYVIDFKNNNWIVKDIYALAD